MPKTDPLARWIQSLHAAWPGNWPDLEPTSFVRTLNDHRWEPTFRDRLVVGRGRDAPLENSPLARAIDTLQRRDCSSMTLTRAALDRLHDAARRYHAVISLDAERALAGASAADKRRRRGDQTPALLGLPLAHKALFYRRGLACSGGSDARNGFIPRVTATALDRLDAAGAIDLGQLHTTEAALDPSGLCSSIGPCRNPWDTAYVPGGSSSGSAVAVATRAITAALGSDTGGSVRIPAALCGVTGLKPTYGCISRHGVMPVSHTCDHVGILASSARDCGILLSIIAGHDDHDPTTWNHFPDLSELPRQTRLDGLRIGVPQAFFHVTVAPSLRANLDASLQTFAKLGAELREVPMFDYAQLNALAAIVLHAEASAVHAVSLRQPDDHYSEQIRQRLAIGLEIPAQAYAQANALRGHVLSRFMKTVMDDIDVLHLPVTAIATPEIETADGRSTIDASALGELTRMTRPFNYLGLPALVLPCGFGVSRNGRPLPQGMQLVGRPFSETSLIQIGDAYQQVTDWHQRQPVDQ